jgi:beta-barrel assembly-enhancing protease
VKFENPEIRHEMNVSPAHPVRDFLSITLSIVVIAGLAAATLYFAAGAIASRVPFAAEVSVAARFFPDQADATGRQDALRALAARLAAQMNIPPEIVLRVHYRDEPTVNALATLGGNIVVYRGLLERMPHENALAMVLAHEIAHVQHRDATVGAGRGLALAVVLGALSAAAGDIVAGTMAGSAAQLTALTFGREQEATADQAGLGAVARVYGHVAGAADLFRTLQTEAAKRGASEPPRFLATHPLTQARIDRLGALARENGWREVGPTTPLTGALVIPKKPSDTQ